MWQGFAIDSLPAHYTLDIWPEPDYPRGREARELALLWETVRQGNVPGLLLLGCDVAADPDDYEAMCTAAFLHPEAVHTGMVKLWPASTGRTEWMWSHRGGRRGAPEATQLDPIHIAYFSLGFVYVPRKLLDIAFPTYAHWKWGEMDVGLSELAWQYSIPIRAVYDARPKHLHFTESHNR